MVHFNYGKMGEEILDFDNFHRAIVTFLGTIITYYQVIVTFLRTIITYYQVIVTFLRTIITFPGL